MSAPARAAGEALLLYVCGVALGWWANDGETWVGVAGGVLLLAWIVVMASKPGPNDP